MISTSDREYERLGTIGEEADLAEINIAWSIGSFVEKLVQDFGSAGAGIPLSSRLLQ